MQIHTQKKRVFVTCINLKTLSNAVNRTQLGVLDFIYTFVDNHHTNDGSQKEEKSETKRHDWTERIDFYTVARPIVIVDEMFLKSTFRDVVKTNITKNIYAYVCVCV